MMSMWNETKDIIVMVEVGEEISEDHNDTIMERNYSAT